MSDTSHLITTTPAERGEFARLFTGGRMDSYDRAVLLAGGTLDGLEVYSYNMALAGAYLGPIHILEVVTRNAIHEVMRAHTGRQDWWDCPTVTFVQRQQQAVAAAEAKVDRQLRGRRSRTPDDIVAALTALVSPPIAGWVSRRSRLRYVAANAPGSATPLRTF